ncbi:MAG: radical SAM protein [Candidatus Aenigmatarchaeota archaeon]
MRPEPQIALIQPSYRKVYGFKEDISSILPPLNLMYLSSYLKQKGYETKIIDLEIEDEKTLDKILEEDKIKIFGITGVTSLFPVVDYLAKKIKSYNKENIVIYGGPHASAVKETLFEVSSSIDFIVVGEGEETLEELVNHFFENKILSSIDGLIYKLKNKIYINKVRKIIQNLDILPFPDHDSIDYEKYKPSIHRAVGFPFAVMITSRGCPFKCKYCGTQTVFGESVRFRSVRNIIDEIKYLKEKFKINNVIFWDDTITLNKQRMIELCENLKNHNISWSCNTRPDMVDAELLEKIKEAGCKMIFYGIESSNEKILEKLGRKMKLKSIENAIKLTKEVGIRCTASMMIGTPFDTKESIHNNIDYMIKLNPDFAFFSVFAPHPGTLLYNYCVKNKIIPSWKEWMKMSFNGVPLNHPTACPNFTREEIQKLLEYAYEKFYSREEFFKEREKKFNEDWELKILEKLKEKFKK